MLALCFPPFGLWWLLPIALAPWAGALFVEERRLRALFSGVILGIVFWCLSVPWVSFVVTRFGGQPAWMGVICVFLLSLILCEWPALVGAIAVSAFPPRSPLRLAAFPLLWMASEHARSVAYKGFPWNLAANALAEHPVWLQTASWWGAYGIGAIAAAAAALVAALFLVRTGRGRVATACAIAFGAVLLWSFGHRRMNERIPSPLAPVRVACVQPNLPQSARETADGAARQYEAVIGAVRIAAARRPQLILIPESSFYGATWQRSATLRRDLSEIAASSGASVLFNDLDEESDDVYFNAARLLTPGGLAPATYRKVHLVPFGEYVPLPRLFFFMKSISRAVGSFSAAPTPVVLSAAGLALGPAVCYEMTYPSLARREVRDGATLLVSISNDAWYGKAGAQEQHFEALVLRAIENGRPFARAAITGVSGAADARGRIVARVPADVTGVVEATLTPQSGRTVWSRWGGTVFPGIADTAAIAMVSSALASALRRRLRRRRGAPQVTRDRST